MVGLAERLIEKAEHYGALATHHEEQATAGTELERAHHTQSAYSFSLVELTLREVAQAFADEEEGDELDDEAQAA